MAAAEERGEAHARPAVFSLQPSDALETFEAVLRHDTAQILVGNFDWPRFLDQFPSDVQPPCFRSSQPNRSGPRCRALKNRISTGCWKQPAAEKGHVLMEYVRGLAAKVLAFETPQQIDVREPLREMGLDSMMALDLTKLLGQAAGRRLPATLLFNHPTVESLAGVLAGTVFGWETTNAQTVPERDEGMAKTAAEIEGMSRAEVEALLESELAQLDEMEL
jgi:acyl carrier protein